MKKVLILIICIGLGINLYATPQKEKKPSVKAAVVSAAASGTVVATVAAATTSLLNYACNQKVPVLLIAGVLGANQAITSGLKAYKARKRLTNGLENGMFGGYVFLINAFSPKTGPFSLHKLTTPAVAAGYIAAVASGTAVKYYTPKFDLKEQDSIKTRLLKTVTHGTVVGITTGLAALGVAHVVNKLS